MFLLFRFTTNISNKFLKFIDEYYYVINKVEDTALVFLLISGVFSCMIQPMIWISSFFMLLFFICTFIKDVGKIFISLKKFLGRGFLYWFVISVLLFTFLLSILCDYGSQITYLVVGYVLFSATWIFYCLLANSKVAKIANFLLSSIFGIIVLLKDFILSILPDNFAMKTIEALDGYSCTQLVEIAFNFVFTPILITNIVAMAICELKGYWIEKYNNDQDVGDL